MFHTPISPSEVAGAEIEGPLAFSSVGVLVSVCAPLAEAGISVLVTSTYNTDCALVREALLERTLDALGPDFGVNG